MRVGICTKCGSIGRQFSQRCFNCNEARFRFVDAHDSAKIKEIQAEISGTRLPGSELKSLMVVGLVVSSVALAAFYVMNTTQPSEKQSQPAISSSAQNIQ